MKKRKLLIGLGITALLSLCAYGYAIENDGGGRSSVLERLFGLVIKEKKEVNVYIDESVKVIDETDKIVHSLADILQDADYYYDDAKDLANEISDNTIRNRMIGKIEASKKIYAALRPKITEKIETFKAQRKALMNEINAVKISHTIPKIEETLQVALKPDQGVFGNLAAYYSDLIKRGEELSK